MPGPGSIMLNLSLEEYNALQAAKVCAEEETAEVRKQLAIAKSVDGDERVSKITLFANDCLTIVRFAVANLPPEMIRGWPYEHLRAVAQGLESLPTYTLSERDMAIDLLSFARECESHEIRRRAEPRATKMTPADIEEHRKRMEADPIGRALIEKMNPGAKLP